MLDTTPVTATITAMIRTGTTEQALLTAVAHLFPNSIAGRAVGGPAGSDRGGREACCEEALTDRMNATSLLAQALLAGLLQRLGERHRDAAMIAAGERLASRIKGEQQDGDPRHCPPPSPAQLRRQ